MKIIGIEVRTSNQMEADPRTAKIPGLWKKFLEERAEEKIPNRKTAHTLLAAYTHYESDYNGPYSLIASSEVSSLDDIPAGMVGITIPAAKYLVFTAKGEMPDALIETWGYIWKYFSKPSNYKRAYTADFELYEKTKNSEVDIYIAIR